MGPSEGGEWDQALGARASQGVGDTLGCSPHPPVNRQLCSISALHPESWARHHISVMVWGKPSRNRRDLSVRTGWVVSGLVCDGWISSPSNHVSLSSRVVARSISLVWSRGGFISKSTSMVGVSQGFLLSGTGQHAARAKGAEG